MLFFHMLFLFFKLLLIKFVTISKYIQYKIISSSGSINNRFLSLIMLFTVVEIVIQQVLLLLLLLFLRPKHPKNPNIPLSSFAVGVVEGDVLLIASSSSSDLTRTHNRFSRFRNHVIKESHWLRDFFICRISLFKDSINVES